MGKYDLVARCGDYCGGCGQYNGIIISTAKQMREFADLNGFEFRSKETFNFKQFLKRLEWFIENAKCPGCKQGGGRLGVRQRNVALKDDCVSALSAKIFHVLKSRVSLTPIQKIDIGNSRR